MYTHTKRLSLLVKWLENGNMGIFFHNKMIRTEAHKTLNCDYVFSWTTKRLININVNINKSNRRAYLSKLGLHGKD